MRRPFDPKRGATIAARVTLTPRAGHSSVTTRPVRLDGLERERRADRRSLGLHVGQAATTGGTRLGRPRIGDPGAVVLDRERHALRRGEHRDRDRSTRGVSRDIVEGERCDPEGRALHGPRRPDLRGVEHVHRHPRRSALLDALRQPLEARDQAQLLQHDRAPLRKQALDLAQDVAEVGRQPFDRAARLDRRQRAPYGGHDLGMELRGEPRALRFGRLVARRRPARHQLIDEGRDARVQPARQAVDEPPIGRSGRPRDGPSASPSVRRHHIAQDAQPDEAQSRVLPPAHGECHDAHDGLARLGHRVGDDRPDGEGTGHDQPRGGHDPQPADGSVEAPRRGCGVAGGGRDRRRQCHAQDRRERRRARQSRWVADHEPEVDQVGRDDRVRRDGREPGEARLAAQPDAHDAQGRDRRGAGPTGGSGPVADPSTGGATVGGTMSRTPISSATRTTDAAAAARSPHDGPDAADIDGVRTAAAAARPADDALIP